MTLVPDIGAALGQTLFGEGGKPFSDPNRVPMIFTSLKRLRQASASLASTRYVTEAQVLNSQQTAGSTDMLTAIEMAVNPNSISFRQPKRIVKRDTQEGSVFFHFTNSKGENNDILTMEFRGNTGNLDFRGDVNTDQGIFSTQGGYNTGAGRKLLLWQNLWALTREAMLLDDKSRNEFLILYSSVGIPVQISLIGHYNSVLEFTENAEKPFTRDYSMSFTVQEIVPPLDDLPGIIQQAVVTENPSGQV